MAVKNSYSHVSKNCIFTIYNMSLFTLPYLLFCQRYSYEIFSLNRFLELLQCDTHFSHPQGLENVKVVQRVSVH